MIVIVPDLTKVQNSLDLLVNDNNNDMILNAPAIQKRKGTNPKEGFPEHTILQHQRIQPVELEEESSTRLSSPNSNTIHSK